MLRPLILFCGIALSSVMARADALTLEALLTKLSKVEGLSAQFDEEKKLSLLTAPLQSEGALFYQRPRRLARHTRKPEAQSVLLVGDTLKFGDARHVETMGVDAQPALRMLIDTFVSVLAGDKAALDKLAAPKFSAQGEAWQLTLVPRDPKLLRIVRSLAFEGDGVTLTRMEVVDGHGDVTRTRFHDAHVGGLSVEQQKRVFRIGG